MLRQTFLDIFYAKELFTYTARFPLAARKACAVSQIKSEGIAESVQPQMSTLCDSTKRSSEGYKVRG